MVPQRGFTLVELLVVVTILGIIAAGSFAIYDSVTNNAKESGAKQDLIAIKTAMSLLGLYTGEWPGHQPPDTTCSGGGCSGNEIEDLSTTTAGLTQTDGSFTNWDGPYIEEIPVDPWGNNYFFDTDYDVGGDTKAVIGSYGPNGVGLDLYDSDDVIIVVAD